MPRCIGIATRVVSSSMRFSSGPKFIKLFKKYGEGGGKKIEINFCKTKQKKIAPQHGDVYMNKLYCDNFGNPATFIFTPPRRSIRPVPSSRTFL